MRYRLVTRRGCHLCDEAEACLRDLGADFEAVDVDADSELLRLYDFRVPVLMAAGRVVLEGRLDRERVAAALSV